MKKIECDVVSHKVCPILAESCPTCPVGKIVEIDDIRDFIKRHKIETHLDIHPCRILIEWHNKQIDKMELWERL